MSAENSGDLGPDTLGDRLRLLMGDQKMTVGEMAKVAGVSKRAFETYLSGLSSPRLRSVAAICRRFDISAHWLIFGAPAPVSTEDHTALQVLAVDELKELIRDLRSGTGMAETFFTLEPGTSEWKNFAQLTARSAAFRIARRYAQHRRGISTTTPGHYRPVAFEEDGDRPREVFG